MELADALPSEFDCAFGGFSQQEPELDEGLLSPVEGAIGLRSGLSKKAGTGVWRLLPGWLCVRPASCDYPNCP